MQVKVVQMQVQVVKVVQVVQTQVQVVQVVQVQRYRRCRCKYRCRFITFHVNLHIPGPQTWGVW